MYRAIIAAALLILTLPVAGQEQGDFTGSGAIARFKRGDVGIRMYVLGVAEGLGWANIESSTPLYCQPMKLGLSAEQLFDIMENYIKEHPNVGGYSVGMVVKEALKDVFPCKP